MPGPCQSASHLSPESLTQGHLPSYLPINYTLAPLSPTLGRPLLFLETLICDKGTGACPQDPPVKCAWWVLLIRPGRF